MRGCVKLLLISVILFSVDVFGKPTPGDLKFYRNLTLQVRPEAEFKIPMPGGNDMFYDYKLEFGEPIYPQPVTVEAHFDNGGTYTLFFDRIWLKDGSYVTLSGEQIPLTCIFIKGQDNRDSGNNSPLFPEIILKVYIVANDFTCQGPIRPGWPKNGGKEENWDTYIRYEIHDPTIMLPVDTGIRYRWNEYSSVLIK